MTDMPIDIRDALDGVAGAARNGARQTRLRRIGNMMERMTAPRGA
jgi:hypothetical protein